MRTDGLTGVHGGGEPMQDILAWTMAKGLGGVSRRGGVEVS